MEEWLFIQNEVYPVLLKGFWVSVQLILPSSIFGLAIGILVEQRLQAAEPARRAEPGPLGEDPALDLYDAPPPPTPGGRQQSVPARPAAASPRKEVRKDWKLK